MSSILKTIPKDEYLRRERAAEFKSEYLHGEVFAMAGGSPNHSLIAANFVREAGNGLKTKPCSVFTSDLRIKVEATDLYTYPDASIVCGELQFDDESLDTIVNPAVIVEVLSESTEKYDRGRKAEHYRQIRSLKELVLIAQDQYHVERFMRQADGTWLFQEVKSLDQCITLDSIEIPLLMAELYRGVRFTSETEHIWH